MQENKEPSPQPSPIRPPKGEREGNRDPTEDPPPTAARPPPPASAGEEQDHGERGIINIKPKEDQNPPSGHPEFNRVWFGYVWTICSDF